jgi:hypothetical protein
MKKNITFLLILTSIMFSCSKKDTNIQKKYFDLSGLIAREIVDLKKSNITISKTWMIDNITDNKTLDSIDFEKEFAFFLQSDINKSAYLKSYIEEKTDSSTTYKLISTENLPVKSILIKNGNNKSLNFIQIISSVDNYLYKTNSVYSLEMLNNQIVNYKIKSTQKLFWGKPQLTEVTGKINYIKDN